MGFISSVQQAQTKFKGYSVRIKDWSSSQGDMSALKWLVYFTLLGFLIQHQTAEILMLY